MPGFDGTGPRGGGAMTGRGLGRCNPNNVGQNFPDYQQWQGLVLGFRRGFGAGFGRGQGLGMGARPGFPGRGRGAGRRW